MVVKQDSKVTEQEIDQMEKSFDYLVSKQLSMDTFEVLFPDKKRYNYTGFIEMNDKLMARGEYRIAAENYTFGFKYLRAFFDSVNQRVRLDYETMLRIIDRMEAYIADLERDGQKAESRFESETAELEDMTKRKKKAQGDLYWLDDMVEFLRARIVEINRFMASLTEKESKIDAKEASKLVISEFVKLQKLVNAKVGSKFHPDDVPIPDEPPQLSDEGGVLAELSQGKRGRKKKSPKEEFDEVAKKAIDGAE